MRDLRLFSFFRWFAPCAAAIALVSCAAPAGAPSEDEAFTPSLPPLHSVVGDAPSQADILDDVKSDGPVPAKFTDLVAQQSPIRQQGDRGVCTIFASTALLEHLAIKQGTLQPDFSEQFLQWSEKRERPNAEHDEASTLPDVMDNLAARGTVAELAWPYESRPWAAPAHPSCTGAASAQPVSCFTNGEPSAAALAAPRNKLPVGRYLRTTAIKSYIYMQKTAVAVGVDFIDAAWSYPPTQYKSRPGAWERGEVPFPSAVELRDARSRPREGHAVLIVGWDDNYEVPVIGDNGLPVTSSAGLALVERGFYIVKNSWGTTYWGKSNPYGAGYGLISQRYIEELGTAYVTGLPGGTPPASGGELHTGTAGLAITPGMPTIDAIAAMEGPLTSAQVQIAIEHPHPADLKVTLVHENITWTLWDHAASAQPLRGIWNMNGDFSRTDRGGAWELHVEDDASGASGTLTSWSLTFK